MIWCHCQRGGIGLYCDKDALRGVVLVAKKVDWLKRHRACTHVRRVYREWHTGQVNSSVCLYTTHTHCNLAESRTGIFSLAFDRAKHQHVVSDVQLVHALSVTIGNLQRMQACMHAIW